MAVNVESGVCLAFGGTNARIGYCAKGDVVGFKSVPTPVTTDEFFTWMARACLEAAEGGARWMVAGFPGPVTPDGTMIGPMNNVSGLSSHRFMLLDELTKRDSAFDDLVDENFRLVPVNDGELAAQAAAHHIGEREYAGEFNRVAALILGTGVGAGIVTRDESRFDVFRTDRTNPAEIGHTLVGLSGDPNDTYENTVSGPAIARRYGADPLDLLADHPAWEKVGRAIGVMATSLSLMFGTDLIVPTGGLGAGASDKYYPHLIKMLDGYALRGNTTQRVFRPAIKTIPSSEAQTFELFGAEGVMRDVLTRAS